MIDLVLGAFFFAMRACEYSFTPKSGKTKRVTVGDLKFRDRHKQVVALTDPMLCIKAQYVTVTFRDQKNATKMDSRLQQRSGHPILCPVLRFSSAVRRIMLSFLSWSLDFPLSSVFLATKVTHVHSDLIRDTLQQVCRIQGTGANHFGLEPTDIGNKSIRSGAAMATNTPMGKLYVSRHGELK